MLKCYKLVAVRAKHFTLILYRGYVVETTACDNGPALGPESIDGEQTSELPQSIGPALALLLLIGVGLALKNSLSEKRLTDEASRRSAGRITVKVLTGSEKEKFLTDPELAKVLDAEGISITVQKAGSREIATRPDLKTFDLAYPAGAPAAVKISQTTGSKRIFTSFYTPMAVASWKPLIPVLEKSGVVAIKDGSFFIVDMAKLVEMMQKGTRWKDLPGNTAYAVGKSVLVSSTDVRKSNSGGIYLALAAYIANGNNVFDNDSDADKIGDSMVGLFSRQGFQESSSAGPFEDDASYLRGGAVDVADTGAIAVTLEPAAGSNARTATPIIVAPVAEL